MEQHTTHVGLGLLIVRDDMILLGERKGSHGSGEYAGPGGHLEWGETFEQCLEREVEEEIGTGLQYKNLRILCVTNPLIYGLKHYVDIGFVAEWESGEPQVMEPNKVVSWDWHPINNLPAPLFQAIPRYVDAYLSGTLYLPAI